MKWPYLNCLKWSSGWGKVPPLYWIWVSYVLSIEKVCFRGKNSSDPRKNLLDTSIANNPFVYLLHSVRKSLKMSHLCEQSELCKKNEFSRQKKNLLLVGNSNLEKLTFFNCFSAKITNIRIFAQKININLKLIFWRENSNETFFFINLEYFDRFYCAE